MFEFVEGVLKQNDCRELPGVWVHAGRQMGPIAHRLGWNEATAVATDRAITCSFSIARAPLVIFDRDGSFLTSWRRTVHDRTSASARRLRVLHGRRGPHRPQVHARGRLLFTLGTREASDTAQRKHGFPHDSRRARPFHYPCNRAIAPTGDIYVCDGYGTRSSRIHARWPASARGANRVAGRGNSISRTGSRSIARALCTSRIARTAAFSFSLDGDYLPSGTMSRGHARCSWQGWIGLCRGAGLSAGMWPGTTALSGDATGGRVSVFDAKGKRTACWGGGDNPTEQGDFFAPHDICVDSRGDVYVAEVTMSAGGNRGLVSPDCPSLQKFVLS